MVMCLLASCTKPQFSLVVTLPASVSESYNMMYYASEKKKGWITETVIPVQDGKATLQGAVYHPSLVWVGRGGSKTFLIAFYVERGDKIEITGTEADPLTWTITGNGINKQWSEWRKKNLSTLRSGKSENINAAVAKYVEKNRDKELSTLLMLTTYDRYIDEEGYTRLWNLIDSSAKDAEIIAAVGRADQLTAARVDPPEKITSLDLHCYGETIMNIRPSASDALALYFSRGDENERGAHIDSLKALFKKRPSDKRLFITDVALTRDSMSWLNKMRSDSIAEASEWLHAWAPGGRMHSSIAMFRIPRLPWFVIIDTKGNQVYRGDDAQKAVKAVRDLLAKAPVRKEAPAPAEKKDSTNKQP